MRNLLKTLKYNFDRWRAERKIRPGDIYEDCSYHPVLCTENIGGDLAGISLIDGSSPRCCSMFHCGVYKMKVETAVEIKRRFNDPAYMEEMAIKWGSNG